MRAAPTAVADARGLALSQDTGALEAAVDAVIAANPDVADKIRDGKVQAVGALIGQVMREMKGRATPPRPARSSWRSSASPDLGSPRPLPAGTTSTNRSKLPQPAWDNFDLLVDVAPRNGHRQGDC